MHWSHHLPGGPCSWHSSLLFHILGKTGNSNILCLQYPLFLLNNRLYHHCSVQLGEGTESQQGYGHVPQRSGEGHDWNLAHHDDPLVLWCHWLLGLHEDQRHGDNQSDACVPNPEWLVRSYHVPAVGYVVQTVPTGPVQPGKQGSV